MHTINLFYRFSLKCFTVWWWFQTILSLSEVSDRAREEALGRAAGRGAWSTRVASRGKQCLASIWLQNMVRNTPFFSKAVRQQQPSPVAKAAPSMGFPWAPALHCTIDFSFVSWREHRASGLERSCWGWDTAPWGQHGPWASTHKLTTFWAEVLPGGTRGPHALFCFLGKRWVRPRHFK